MNFNEATAYDEYHKSKKESKLNYIKSLLDPFNTPLVRAPSCVKVPTALLRDVQSFQINVGAAGDFIGLFTPENIIKNQNSTSYYDWVFCSRATSALDYSTLTYYGHGGSATTSNYTTQNKSTSLTYGNFMQHARLVSAGLRIRYIGRADAHAGMIICGALPLNVMSTQPVLFSNEVNELMFSKRVTPLQGLNVNWIPQDESSKEFKMIAASGLQQYNVFPQLGYAFYGFGLPTGTCLDVEIVRNYEYIPPYNYIELLMPEAERIQIPDELPAVNEVISRNLEQLTLGAPEQVLDSVSQVLSLARGLI